MWQIRDRAHSQGVLHPFRSPAPISQLVLQLQSILPAGKPRQHTREQAQEPAPPERRRIETPSGETNGAGDTPNEVFIMRFHTLRAKPGFCLF